MNLSVRGLFTIVWIVILVSFFQSAVQESLGITIGPFEWSKAVVAFFYTAGGIFITIAWDWASVKYPRKRCEESGTGSGGD